LASRDRLWIRPRCGHPEICSLVAASHTHSGPGGLWDSYAAGLLGAGMPDETQRWAVQRALDEAVRQAEAALGPAELQMGREMWTKGPAQARSEGPIDPEIVALRLRRPSGPGVAALGGFRVPPASPARRGLPADLP